MRTSPTTLGIIGGVLGLIAGAINVIIGARFMPTPLGLSPLGVIIVAVVISVLPFVFAILGLVGGTITSNNPGAGGILMLVGGIGGFLAGVSWLPAGILLIIAGRRSLKQKT